jgi:uncharacterized protein YbjT (DUF2867 family)
MEIAVMGATGNVGSELVRLLAHDGHGVRALSSQGQPMEGWPAAVRSFAGCEPRTLAAMGLRTCRGVPLATCDGFLFCDLRRRD